MFNACNPLIRVNPRFRQSAHVAPLGLKDSFSGFLVLSVLCVSAVFFFGFSLRLSVKFGSSGFSGFVSLSVLSASAVLFSRFTPNARAAPVWPAVGPSASGRSGTYRCGNIDRNRFLYG